MTAFLIAVIVWFLFGAIVNLISIGIGIGDRNSSGARVLANGILALFYLGMATWGIFLLVS